MDIKLPCGETPTVSYFDWTGAQKFLLTKKRSAVKVCFILYEVLQDGSLKKLGKGDTPPELEEKFRVNEKIMEIPCKRSRKKLQ